MGKTALAVPDRGQLVFMTKISVLDLAPVREGSNPGDALRNSRDLARHAESFGYERFWLAEHHNMVGIASAAPRPWTPLLRR